jgi:hypothetical protein
MNNIKIHKEAGGMGAEIDILATNKKKIFGLKYLSLLIQGVVIKRKSVSRKQ